MMPKKTTRENVMNQNAHSTRLVGLALTTALASVALSGCTVQGATRADIAASRSEAALAKGNTAKAISEAEQAVLAQPRHAAYRAVLGTAYLNDGRFKSAATSFDDAMALGDNSARTALSLALANIGAGDMKQAAAVLDDWRDEIAPGDLGLAYALAGQPDRGIHILSSALRAGENTPKIRQNLAYSYALAGRWRDARLMARQDISADQIHDRIELWSQTAHPMAYQQRMAGLLEVPADRRDPGQPALLALQNYPAAEQLASEAAALETQLSHNAAPPELTPVPTNDAEAVSDQTGIGFEQAFASDIELAPLPKSSTQNTPAKVQPEVELARYEAAKPANPQNFEAAFATKAPQGATPAAVITDTVRFVNEPALRKMPARYGIVPEPKSAPGLAAASGDHLIQLGSFYSEQGARRAWGIYANRLQGLEGHEMTISRAVVRGKNYWRVSAAGFEKNSANSLCATVKQRGEDCIPYHVDKPLPGAIK